MIDGAYVQDLRAALTRADFTVDAVFALLGEDAHRALGRNQTVPARRATSGGGELATLVRLFALQVPVDRARADAALPGLVEPLVAAGMLEAVRRTRCAPWSTSDRTATRSTTGGSCAIRRRASTAGRRR